MNNRNSRRTTPATGSTGSNGDRFNNRSGRQTRDGGGISSSFDKRRDDNAQSSDNGTTRSCSNSSTTSTQRQQRVEQRNRRGGHSKTYSSSFSYGTDSDDGGDNVNERRNSRVQSRSSAIQSRTNTTHTFQQQQQHRLSHHLFISKSSLLPNLQHQQTAKLTHGDKSTAFSSKLTLQNQNRGNDDCMKSTKNPILCKNMMQLQLLTQSPPLAEIEATRMELDLLTTEYKSMEKDKVIILNSLNQFQNSLQDGAIVGQGSNGTTWRMKDELLLASLPNYYYRCSNNNQEKMNILREQYTFHFKYHLSEHAKQAFSSQCNSSGNDALITNNVSSQGIYNVLLTGCMAQQVQRPNNIIKKKEKNQNEKCNGSDQQDGSSIVHDYTRYDGFFLFLQDCNDNSISSNVKSTQKGKLLMKPYHYGILPNNLQDRLNRYHADNHPQRTIIIQKRTCSLSSVSTISKSPIKRNQQRSVSNGNANDDCNNKDTRNYKKFDRRKGQQFSPNRKMKGHTNHQSKDNQNASREAISYSSGTTAHANHNIDDCYDNETQDCEIQYLSTGPGGRYYMELSSGECWWMDFGDEQFHQTLLNLSRVRRVVFGEELHSWIILGQDGTCFWRNIPMSLHNSLLSRQTRNDNADARFSSTSPYEISLGCGGSWFVQYVNGNIDYCLPNRVARECQEIMEEGGEVTNVSLHVSAGESYVIRFRKNAE